MSIVFFPPKSIDDINDMNDDELVEGYLAGLYGGNEPRDSRSKWTGWRNGMVDSGRRKIDDAQRQVARQFVSR